MNTGTPFSLFTSHFSRSYQILLRFLRCNLRAFNPPEHVHLAPDAKLAGQVDPRLNREPDTRPEPPVIVRLVIIQIGAGAVEVAVDRVPRAVHEPLTEARPLDHTTGGAVGFVR